MTCNRLSNYNISCQVRAKVKARKTNGSVDATKQNAANTALQNAALELTERLVPKLVK